MSRPAQAQDHMEVGVVDRVRLVRQRFENAWKQALKGGEQPSLEHYLAESAESEQSALRDELEPIDRSYRQTLSVVRAATLDFVPTDTKQDTFRGGAEPTIDLPPRPTIDLETEHTVDLGRPTPVVEQPEAPTVPGRPEIPGYEILDELGRGGMGVVYKARQLKLDRTVALKMIRVGSSDDPAYLARFRTETQAVAQLQHPNIVQIYEVGERAGQHYFSLEFVDGGDLAGKVSGQPQPVTDAAQMVATLAQAMTYAHQHGIIHRDLKPANILLTTDGVPKIADFGLAKRIEAEEASSQTRTGSLLGTPSYMAPEQARGELREAGAPADVYALGAILYVMLTGRPPFCGATATDTIMQVLTQEPVPPSRLRSDIPRDLETICLKALEKELSRRYATAAALAEDLRRFLAGEPILARPVGVVEHYWRWCRRNPGLATLSGSVALLLVVVAITSTIFAFAFANERDEKERQRHNAIEARDQIREKAGELEIARNRADDNARLANDNASLANEQANLALETLSTLLVSVRENLKDTPGTQRLKQAFVRDTLEKLDRIAPGVERLKLTDLNQAEAHRFLGTIYLELGRLKEARPHFEQCHALLEKLASNALPTEQARRDLTVAYHVLGDFRLLVGDVPAAYKLYKKALDLRQAILNINPKSDQARIDLATSHVKLGNASEPEEALRHYDAALKLRKELESAADARNTPLRRDVWIVYNFQGDAYLRLKKPEAALECYREGLTRAEKLVEIAPRSAGFKQTLAISHEKLGTAYRHKGDAKLAADHYAKALDIIRPLAKDDPDNLSLQASLVLLLARSGAHQEASDRGPDLLRLAPDYGNHLYNVACCYALCAAAIDAGKKPDQLTAKEADLRKRYTTASLKLLTEAVKQGFSNLTLLRTDPDLDAIRAESEFVSLVKKLK